MSDQLAVIQSQKTIEELKAIDSQLASLIAHFNETISIAKQFNDGLLSGKPKELGHAINGTNKAIEGYSKSLNSVNDIKIRLAKIEEVLLNNALREQKIQTELNRTKKEAANATTAEIRLKQKQEAVSKANQKAVSDESSAYKRLIKEVNTAKLKAKDLEAEILILNRDLKSGVISQEEYATRLKIIQNEYQSATNKAKSLSSELTVINNKFKNSTGLQGVANSMVSSFDKTLKNMAAMYLGFHVLMRGGTELVKTNYDLSDSLYDLQVRLHGDKEATDKLFESLKKLDTRTSLGELVNTASIVAKKGVAASEIEGITKALDNYFIVAGKEAGDREEGTASIIKLISIFNDDKQVTAERVTEIATALVKLQNSGVATGSKMIDVAERIGAIRGLTGISLPQVLGFAAAIEQLGQKSEVAGTAGMQILTKIFSDVPKYAKMAGKSVQEFRQILKDDPFSAMVSVAEGLVKSGDFEKISQDLEEVGIRGARVKGVLGDIAGNADFVKKRIKEAGYAINEAGYLAEVAAGKQQTFAASVDKMKKELELTASSDKFANFLKNGTKLITFFIKAIVSIPFGVVITGLTLWAAAWGYMKGNVISATIAQSWNNKETLLGIVRNAAARLGLLGAAEASRVKTAALIAETTATNEATAATTALNVATKASPLGIILGILAAIIPLMSLYGDKTEKAARKVRTLKENQDDLNDAMKKGAYNAGEEVSKLEQLYKKATDTNVSMKERLEAVKELKKEFPSYFSKLEDEIILNGKATSSYNELRDAIVASSRAEAIKDKLKGRESERLDRDTDLRKKFDDELRNYKQLKATPNESTTYRQDTGDGKSINFTVTNKELIAVSQRKLFSILKEINKFKTSDRKSDELLLKMLYELDNKSAKYREDQLKKLGSFSANGDGETGKASTLTGDQKDYLKDLEAKKDLELAVNERYYTIGERDEETYIKKNLSINKEFLYKKINYLKGSNAEERKEKAQALLELAKLEKETAEKIMEIRINAVDAWRDNELADLKERKIKGAINETQYWEQYKDIQVKYRDKIQDLINKADSKMLKLDAKTKMKLFDNLQKANDEIFKEEKKSIEKRSSIAQIGTNKKMSAVENDDTKFEIDKIPARDNIYNEQIANASKKYSDELKIAVDTRQDESVILGIIADRDKEISDLEDKKLANLKNSVKAQQDYVDYFREIEDLKTNAKNLDEQTEIISNSKLKNADKEYLLSKRQYEQKDIAHDLEIARLESDILSLEIKEKLTIEEAKQLAILKDKLAAEKNAKTVDKNTKSQEELQHFKDQWNATLDYINGAFDEFGLNHLSNTINKEFDNIYNAFKKGGDNAKRWEEVTVLAASAVADALTMVSNTQKEQTIANLDEQLKASQKTSEQEIGFINQRLEYLNNLEDATAEQIQERNRLEDEARGMREQQAMREKMIAKQKAKAEQKAAAQQALINGLLAATMALATQAPPASYIMAAISAAMGIAMAASIMSKDPTPQYFVGRKGGKAEWAWTQEKGREIIEDKHGNIKSLGSDNGPQMTWLNEGDVVKTADDTRKFLDMKLPEIDYHKLMYDSFKLPQIIIPKQEDHSQKIIDGVEKAFERVFKKYDKTNVYENEDGDLVIERGNRIPEVRKKKPQKPIQIVIPRPNVRD